MQLGSVNDLLPVLNFASRDRANAGNYWGPRVIPDCQLFYVLSGEAELTLGTSSYRIIPGACCFYGNDRPHRLSILTRTEYVSVHFTWSGSSPIPVHPAYDIRETTKEELEASALIPYQVDCPGYGEIEVPHRFLLPGAEPILIRLVREYEQERPGYPFLLRSLLMDLLMMILRQSMKEAVGHAASKIEAALLAMRAEPSKAWTVAELAERCGYHPSYFTQVFLQEMGQKPKQFLIAERIRLAKQGLLRGESIESLAERLGYASIHYFSSNFKKETGLTPSEYRQQPDRSQLL